MMEKRIIRKIKKYDNEFDEKKEYCYGVIIRGLTHYKKREFLVVAGLLLLAVMGLSAINADSGIIFGLLGGVIGYFGVNGHDYFIAVKKDGKTVLYFLNRFQTKVILKKEVDNGEVEVVDYKEKKGSYTLKLKFDKKDFDIYISKETLGFKNQRENSSKIVEVYLPIESATSE